LAEIGFVSKSIPFFRMVSGVNTQGSTNIQAEAGTVNALAYLRIV
jgi:hypothetical protein